MKKKVKLDLIIWLWIIMLFPVSAIILMFLFNVLAIILGPTTKLDLTVFIYLFLQLMIFLSIYIVLSLKWNKYMVLDKESIKIYEKNICKQKIDFQKIVSIEYFKTSFTSFPLIYFSNGNEIRVNFYDELGNINVFKNRIFYRDLKTIQKEIKIDINLYKSTLN